MDLASHSWADLESVTYPGDTQVGEGVKGLADGDWGVPAVTHLGSWRTLAVCKEADLLKLPSETLPVEHAAVFRELCLAYRLLEDHGNLKVSKSLLRLVTFKVAGALLYSSMLL